MTIKHHACIQRVGTHYLDVPVITYRNARSRRIIDQNDYSILVEDVLYYTVWQNVNDTGTKPYYLVKDKFNGASGGTTRRIHYTVVQGPKMLAEFTERIISRMEARGQAYLAKKANIKARKSQEGMPQNANKPEQG